MVVDCAAELAVVGRRMSNRIRVFAVMKIKTKPLTILCPVRRLSIQAAMERAIAMQGWANWFLHTMVANPKASEPRLQGGHGNVLMENGFRARKPNRIPAHDLQSVHSRRTEREKDGGHSMDAPQTGEGAHIGKSVVIKGELSGSED